MSKEEKYSLMLCCGALWDIAENSKELITQKQIEDVREKIEKLIDFKDDVPAEKYISKIRRK